MSWRNIEKFETCFNLGTLTSLVFELEPEELPNSEIYHKEKAAQIITDLNVDMNNIKVASSTETEEELEKLWLILKQCVDSVPAPARRIHSDVRQFFSYTQIWCVTAWFSRELHSKLKSWKDVYGKGLKIRLHATLTNVTATPKDTLKNKGKTSRDPIWFERLDPVPCGSAETASEKQGERDLEERIGREMPYERDFTFKGDFSFYLWMWRPKEFTEEMKWEFPRQIIIKKEGVNLTLLKEKIHTDMWIVTDSGISIPCHKCFLAVSSPVIAAMFDERWTTTGSGEVASNLLKMESVSEETVHAFLEYAYIDEISKALESLPIAVELLQVANKYNVTLLEEKLLEYLYKKSEKWEDWIPANIDSLFKAYVFLEMSGISELLETLLAKILREKADEILQSEKYMNLLMDDFDSSIKIKKCCETQRSLGIHAAYVKSLHLQFNGLV